MPFLFKEVSPQVILWVIAKGQMVTVLLTMSEDRKTLSLRSDQTGNTSTYVRSAKLEANGCPV